MGTALSLLSTIGYYAAYATIVYRTVLGALSLGDLTLLAGSFSRSRDLIQRMLLTTSDLYEQALYLDDLFVFFAMRPTIAPPGAPRAGARGRSARGSSSGTSGSGTRRRAPPTPPPSAR